MVILAIARNSVVEALREKILYALLVFGGGMVLLSSVLSNLTLGYRIRVVTDLSLTSLLAFGVLLAVLLGAGSVSRDVERRVVLPVLAKPTTRTEYFIGRFLGLCATISLNFFFMATFATAVVAVHSPDGGFPFGWSSYVATVLLVFLRVIIVASLALTLSAIASSTVAQIGALGLAVAGHFSSDLRFFLKTGDETGSRVLAEVLYHALPDLGALDSLFQLIHAQPIASASTAAAVLYALCYGAAALVLGAWAFSRKELS